MIPEGEPIRGVLHSSELLGEFTATIAQDLLRTRQQAWERTESPAYLYMWIQARQRVEAYFPLDWQCWTRPLTRRELMIATLEGWL